MHPGRWKSPENTIPRTTIAVHRKGQSRLVWSFLQALYSVQAKRSFESQAYRHSPSLPHETKVLTPFRQKPLQWQIQTTKVCPVDSIHHVHKQYPHPGCILVANFWSLHNVKGIRCYAWCKLPKAIGIVKVNIVAGFLIGRMLHRSRYDKLWA